jgi:hypothetical protein
VVGSSIESVVEVVMMWEAEVKWSKWSSSTWPPFKQEERKCPMLRS